MHSNLFWQITSDGIVFAMPEGFVNGYYIYPPNYFKDTPNAKYELWLIQEDGYFNRDEISKFDTLEQAQDYAINHIKAIMELVSKMIF
ncbi:MAG: hypothetical protein KBD37_01045 [Burkholderiales bacterium]|nr:hypothetical protein [Burkholderiales bacterium]